ncbi:MAG: hypothetical protein QXG22_01390 [Candidatus Hadarchaeales archaeon]
MKTAVLIPVRIKSTRLPRKPLKIIKGKRAIEHLIERVKTAKLPDLIILCTTIRSEDLILEKIAKTYKIECFRGSEKDIINRLFHAALKYNVDFIVNVDGDDILCDPELVDQTIRVFRRSKADVIRWENLPLGAAPFGIKTEAIKKVLSIKATNNTETGWVRYFTDTGLFKVKKMTPSDERLKRPDIRITLDYPEDLKFFRKIFEKLYKPGKIISLKDVIQLLEKEPQLLEINKNVREIYWKRYIRNSKIKIKIE